MKVEWTLKGMDKIKNQHLQANLEYWKMDLLLNASKFVSKIEKSRFLRWMSKGSEQLKNMVFLAKNRGQMTIEDINQMVDYNIDIINSRTIMTLIVNPNYFSMNETIQAQTGKRMAKVMAKNSVSRQELIDGFEAEIRKTYTKDFTGRIIEDDEQNLSIYH